MTRPSRSDWLSGVRILQFATEPDSLLRAWALCCPLPTAEEAGSAGAHPEATAPAQLWSAFSSLAAGWVPGKRHRARELRPDQAWPSPRGRPAAPAAPPPPLSLWQTGTLPRAFLCHLPYEWGVGLQAWFSPPWDVALQRVPEPNHPGPGTSRDLAERLGPLQGQLPLAESSQGPRHPVARASVSLQVDGNRHWCALY